MSRQTFLDALKNLKAKLIGSEKAMRRTLDQEIGASLFPSDRDDAAPRVRNRCIDLHCTPLEAVDAIIREEERSVDPA